MKKIRKIVLYAVCMVMCMAMQVTAAEQIVFGGTAVQDGSSLKVTLTVEKGSANSGQVVMEYDPDEVELVSATPGTEAAGMDACSLSTEEKGTITIGFADLTPVDSGSIMEAEFRVSDTVPEKGILFHVTAEEWSNEKRNDLMESVKYREYDLVVKDGSATVVPKPEEPGTEPSEEPGTEPSSEPGTEPGTEPSSEPGTEPGAKPSEDSGTGSNASEVNAGGDSEDSRAEASANTQNAATGDNMVIMPVIVLLIIGVLACAAAVFLKKSNQNR